MKSLRPLYDKSEAENITLWVLEDSLGLGKADILIRSEETISELKANDLARQLLRLMKAEPVQYVTGYTHFYGLKLKLNRSVLIPRPETEELVEWIINENKDTGHINILDIGTGSGCIAIALKKNIPECQVYAIDISEDALKVARENAGLNAAEIKFIHHDIFKALSPEPNIPTLDIIVSNPPYVTIGEKETLHKNVLEYEPHEALFVPHDDPVIYYRTISEFAKGNLKNNGKLYFEVNANYGSAVRNMLTESGYSKTELRKDINGWGRMLKAMR